MTRKLIRIIPFGRLGNRMFQHMMAETIRSGVPGSRIVGSHMPEWGFDAREDPKVGTFAVRIRGHVTPLEEIVRLANAVDDIDIQIEAPSCRLDYYRDRLNVFRALFPYRPPATPIAPDELAINIRLEDILGGAHPNYIPLPISWYERLVEDTGLKPVFVGQLADDAYSQALRARFPAARVIADLGPRETFDILRSAENLALSISTFSWLAGWLSGKARVIHLPVAGLYNRDVRPDQDLLPIGDARYRFHAMPLRQWSGAESELETLISADVPSDEISHEALARAFADV